MKSITVEQLKEDLDSKVDFILIDARDTQAYGRAHIPQAKCISPDCGDE
ncbi:MAG: rhodanese-like domain-containing protein, partial [Candidatus Ranarchaeia archaeon]